VDLIVDVKISQNLLDRPVRNVAVGLFAADWKKTDLTSRCGYWATPDRDPVSSAKQPTKKSGDNNVKILGMPHGTNLPPSRKPDRRKVGRDIYDLL